MLLKRKSSTADDSSKAAVFSDAKKNVVTIKVLAKPGSKCNGITDIGPDGVGVQIAAPPVDGEANTELIKYLSKILGLRKSDLSLDRGSKSKNKTVVVHASVAVEDILSKLQSEIDNG
ncbi:UPF0235 protein C15orf40 homolog [Gigantopelta aegis]|uniref:UPF0235 protein C15orf40 homolog n=1 Tax=Gigantopelta aegis TaxID=1735272 RepID=UPI001B88A9A6|nr:UPF0235 protein C15orf40 homolog [Gigantopelta aegis]XP_041369083.1 UPF0235 protein C15orf40 homolog [Gigantopelta aegis]XP_041369092.1 UPF0235 protein C15orf40 homolog [Gigantopelta aegis]XP_041369099.1 UPF0235 protein C15orf40 homolog [Gigantopelta aegis]